MVTEPTLILADEPTGNLDSRSGCEIMALLQELNDEGITVLLVTHDLQSAEHAQRIVELKDGIIVGERAVTAVRRARRELERMAKSGVWTT